MTRKKLVSAVAYFANAIIPKRKSGENTDTQSTEKNKPKKQPLPKPLPPKEKEKKVWEPAEVAFEKNLNRIAPLLRGVTCECITNNDDWTSLIVSINNDDLFELWTKCIKKPELWITYLQTFNLQMDWVESFECLEEYKELYEMEDGSKIEVGKRYYVVCPCWIYTDSNNQKSVILKGIVKPQYE